MMSFSVKARRGIFFCRFCSRQFVEKFVLNEYLIDIQHLFIKDILPFLRVFFFVKKSKKSICKIRMTRYLCDRFFGVIFLTVGC